MLPGSIIITIAVLTLFLSFVVIIKYAIVDTFVRNRALMSAFFLFIVSTLTLSYSEFFFATLPYTIPAGALGVLVGYVLAVQAAKERISARGLSHYMQHFAHLHPSEEFSWWSVINFYTVMSALLLINLVGFTTVILHNLEPMALATSAFGAFLIGTIIPYLIHLWSIKSTSTHNSSKSEA
jgi:hypothetical protein